EDRERNLPQFLEACLPKSALDFPGNDSLDVRSRPFPSYISSTSPLHSVNTPLSIVHLYFGFHPGKLGIHIKAPRPKAPTVKMPWLCCLPSPAPKQPKHSSSWFTRSSKLEDVNNPTTVPVVELRKKPWWKLWAPVALLVDEMYAGFAAAHGGRRRKKAQAFFDHGGRVGELVDEVRVCADLVWNFDRYQESWVTGDTVDPRLLQQSTVEGSKSAIPSNKDEVVSRSETRSLPTAHQTQSPLVGECKISGEILGLPVSQHSPFTPPESNDVTSTAESSVSPPSRSPTTLNSKSSSTIGRRFLCSAKDCGRSFHSQKDLRRHEDSLHNNKTQPHAFAAVVARLMSGRIITTVTFVHVALLRMDHISTLFGVGVER
ncbi:hypothetical protein QBC35DRAFT_97027, partial [Podospora australis]